MEHFHTYILLFAIIVVVAQLFRNSPLPLSLILVVCGMMLSLFPNFPRLQLNPDVVLNFFLPLLVYQISTSTSWKDLKKNVRPITLLSVGHVLFITFVVAVCIHALIPELGWPLSFVLGAVIAPPDCVAIVSIAEKIHMPTRIVAILEGEGMLNDATALIVFRFALAAVITHHFSPFHALWAFFAVVVGETLYGLVLGYILGEIRLKIRNPVFHIIISLLTPFLAYLPAEHLGGCGVLATIVTGFVIGHMYSVRFHPEFRLISLSVWPTVTFAIQSLLFLLVGLNMQLILSRISAIPTSALILYSLTIVLAVIIGRFIWVYVAVGFLPRFLFQKIRKNDPYPPWQYPFIISWAGMRGGISLAAALAVPALPSTIPDANPRDLLVFLVFCVIAATLVLQGLTLPWIIKMIGIQKYSAFEKHDEYHSELLARMHLCRATLCWLAEYKHHIKNDKNLLNQVKLYIREYQMLKKQLKERINNHNGKFVLKESINEEINNEVFILSQIIKIEKTTLLQLWRDDKVNLVIRNKLLLQLDHRTKDVLG
jgi:Na+/H+ antiporter